MKITIQLLLLLTVMILSCKPDLSNPEVEKLYKEVMIIHDEVMPEISTIHKLKKKIIIKYLKLQYLCIFQ